MHRIFLFDPAHAIRAAETSSTYREAEDKIAQKTKCGHLSVTMARKATITIGNCFSFTKPALMKLDGS
jgi:hypothetical protein